MPGFPISRPLPSCQSKAKGLGAWTMRALVVPCVLGGLILAVGCNQAPAAKEKKAIEVTVTTPIADEVIDYQDFTGRLDAVKSVEIRARVSGYLDKSYVVGSRDKDDQDPDYVKEGDTVKKGALLFVIDPRPYQAAFDAAQASLKAAKADVLVKTATLGQVTNDWGRAQQLHETKGIAEAEYDQQKANFQAANANLALSRANVGLQEANLYTAKLNLDWTQVKAPETGRLSRRLVDPGNLVMANTSLLTTIVSEDPLYLYFDVDERTYLDLLTTFKASSSQDPAVAGLKFRVLMRLANQDQFVHLGKVNFLDNRINDSTGTLRMRGEFPNPDGSLKPGLFARVRLPLDMPYRALLISDEAIQTDQGRHFVYVVNEKDEVVYRPVKLGQAIEGLRVIKAPDKGQEGKEGLLESDRVVIVGMQRVRPEAHVQAKLQDPPKPPKSLLRDLFNHESGGRSQDAGVRSQRSEVRGQKSEVNGKKSVIGSQGQKSEVKVPESGREGQKSGE